MGSESRASATFGRDRPRAETNIAQHLTGWGQQMALLGDVLAWSITQPLWVQDALRRVFTVGELTPADYDELIALVLNANGAAIENVPAAQPLAAAHLPAQPNPGTTCLASVSDMHCVNRFAPEVPLRSPYLA